MSDPKKQRRRISHARLLKLLDYDHATGVFTSKTPRRNTRGIGQPCGWTDEKGYVRLFLERKVYFAHVLAWFYVKGRWPKEQLDHFDHEVSKSKVEKLREATHAENARYKKLNKNSTSGFKGVTWFKKNKRWMAQIEFDRKHYGLGYFDDPKEAARAYDIAAKNFFGKFAKTNASLGLL